MPESIPMHHRSFQECGRSHRSILFVRTPENLTLSTFFGLKTKRFELQKWDCAHFVDFFKQISKPTKIFCFEKSEAEKRAALRYTKFLFNHKLHNLEFLKMKNFIHSALISKLIKIEGWDLHRQLANFFQFMKLIQFFRFACLLLDLQA